MSSVDAQSVSKLSEAMNELLADERAVEHVPDEEAWDLLVAAVRLHAAKREAGSALLPEAEAPTATDVVVAVSDLLGTADIELFELGMWQVWGRP